MKYYSTRLKAPLTSLSEAIRHSEAPDGGLYLPQSLPKIPAAIFNNMSYMSLSDISYFVANTLFSPEIPSGVIKKMGEEALNFDIPLVQVSDDIYALELFHGPTGTIKDVCARYMVRLLSYFGDGSSSTLHVLVSTNGNSGSALAKASTEFPGVKFHVFYPKDTRPELIRNIVGQNPQLQAVPVDGTIDDCRKMIYEALNDKKLNDKIKLTSANAFNLGIVLPQIIYYFYAWAQLARLSEKPQPVWMGIPCGNGGGLLAGYMAMLMGLPLQRLVAGCNRNDAMHRFFTNGAFCRSVDLESHRIKCNDSDSYCGCSDRLPSIRTLAYAMDTACPSNLPRFNEMCKGDISVFDGKITSASVSDQEIAATMEQVKKECGYDIDPHGAVAYRCLAERLPKGAKGIVLASRKPGDVSSETLSYAKHARINHIKPIAATYPALKKIIIGNEF